MFQPLPTFPLQSPSRKNPDASELFFAEIVDSLNENKARRIQMADSAREYANEAKSTVEDAASRFKKSASHNADKARQTLDDVGDTVRDYSRDAAHRIEHSVRKYPLGALAGATLVGLIIGSILRR
jgi:ElaB/YqjD/DUF883 family membrane-anchored ribosome-binding protein